MALPARSNVACCERRHAYCAGFTLLEVVVSLAILVVALGSIYGILSNGIKRTDMAADRAAALAVLQSALAQNALTEPAASAAGSDDIYDWVIDVQTSDEPASSTWQLYDVAATISWRDGERTESMHFETKRIASREQR